MKLPASIIFPLAGLGSLLLLAGCATTHYMVTDPQSQNVYYTTKVESASGGAVKLKDDRSGSAVTLQNSEVKEISSEEYEKGLKEPAAAPVPAPAVPAQTPPPAAAPATPPATTPVPAPTGTK